MLMKTITVAMWDPGFSMEDKSLAERIDLLEEKFKSAYEQAMSSESWDSEVTFIFMCPEYTLLNKDEAILGNFNSKKDLLEAEKRFQQLANDYPQAIIIPGTAYVEKTLDLQDETKKTKYVSAVKSWQRNHFRGFFTFEQEIEDKKLIKNTASIFFHSQTNKPKRYSKQVEAEDYLDTGSSIFYPGHASSIFTQNGIRFGIEICADHKKGILNSEQNKKSEPIDVHLIVANVIQTIRDNVAQGDGVIIINCAGNFTYDPHAAKETGVWIRDQSGNLEPVEIAENSTDDLLIYCNIPVPNQTITPQTSM
ncbi:hypothetical protein [Legionella cardiaca]|uniref:CN hydrolase domain-containing protein n=1 Tax=Legionella cardiaca TaxID=1071983 RepID=A0ABY8AU88_9GAMM|nr:hypothetical protein [Legionella cardiaca]WED44240.1 hypothetical protein PXX05_05500 [Legionella cardiaca]